MVPSCHRPTNSVLRANGPVLCKGLVAVDRRCVYTGAGVDVIRAAVTLHRTLEFPAAGWIVATKTFDDVVFDQWVASPAVNSEVAVAVGIVRAGVIYGARRISGITGSW